MALTSTQRVASVLARLLHGETITFDDWQQHYGAAKSTRTFQRDLADIRQALEENNPDFNLMVQDTGAQLVKKGTQNDLQLALALGQIVIASRAFTHTELALVLTELTARLNPDQKKYFENALRMPKNSYYPLATSKPLLGIMQQVIQAIATHAELVFAYSSSRPSEARGQEHTAQPETMYFDQFYFYVVMHEAQGYRVFRLDRIDRVIKTQPGDWRLSAEHFSLQELRQHTYLQAIGPAVTFQFKAWGIWDTTILDRFPQSRILRTEPDGAFVVEATAKEVGAMMWLRSQGDKVQLLSPPSWVAKMQANAKAVLARYQDK